MLNLSTRFPNLMNIWKSQKSLMGSNVGCQENFCFTNPIQILFKSYSKNTILPLLLLLHQALKSNIWEDFVRAQSWAEKIFWHWVWSSNPMFVRVACDWSNASWLPTYEDEFAFDISSQRPFQLMPGISLVILILENHLILTILLFIQTLYLSLFVFFINLGVFCE